MYGERYNLPRHTHLGVDTEKNVRGVSTLMSCRIMAIRYSLQDALPSESVFLFSSYMSEPLKIVNTYDSVFIDQTFRIGGCTPKAFCCF